MSETSRIDVHKIIGSSMIQYAKLDQLINYAYAGSGARGINLFIDLYSIYKTLYSRSDMTKTDNYIEVTSSIMNLCAHYRNYFKKIGVYTTIYIVSGYNTNPYNTKMVSGYNKIMIEKLGNMKVYNMVETNIELIKIMVPYLKDIFFVHTSYETTLMMRYLIMKNGKGMPNIILTRDSYPAQLISEIPQTSLLRPKKNISGMDLSEIIVPREHPNYKNSFWGYTITENEASNMDIDISPVNFPLLAALSRFKDRNIKTIISVPEAAKIIYSAIGSQDVKLDPDALYRMSNNARLMSTPLATVDSRYKTLDATGYQYNLFVDSTESLDINLTNLYDPEALQQINATYFQNDPLDLYGLQI